MVLDVEMQLGPLAQSPRNGKKKSFEILNFLQYLDKFQKYKTEWPLLEESHVE